MISAEELKQNLIAFKKELKKIEDYRQEVKVPLKLPNRVFPLCVWGFFIYLATLLVCVYVFPMPFFKAYSNIATVTFSLVVTTCAPVIMPILFIMAVICKSIVFFKTMDYFVFAKKIFMNGFLKVYFNDAEHQPKYEPPAHEMNFFNKILPAYKYIETEDLITGTVGNIKAKICEVKCKKKVEDSIIVHYQGLLAVFERPQKFEGENYILLKRTWSVSDFPRFTSDNQEFNLLYDTFSSEIGETRLLIDTKFIEKFLKFNKYLKGKMTCILIKNKIYMAIPTSREDFNVVKSLHAEVDQNDVKALLTTFKETLDLVELLENNTHKRTGAM